ncbi:MAG: hypothetical protein HRU19_20085 [Pseudobacteriovorax sp.]|nr:hypothetical protein [Pseudobacteriovorax sp.]
MEALSKKSLLQSVKGLLHSNSPLVVEALCYHRSISLWQGRKEKPIFQRLKDHLKEDGIKTLHLEDLSSATLEISPKDDDKTLSEVVRLYGNLSKRRLRLYTILRLFALTKKISSEKLAADIVDQILKTYGNEEDPYWSGILACCLLSLGTNQGSIFLGLQLLSTHRGLSDDMIEFAARFLHVEELTSICTWIILANSESGLSKVSEFCDQNIAEFHRSTLIESVVLYLAESGSTKQDIKSFVKPRLESILPWRIRCDFVAKIILPVLSAISCDGLKKGPNIIIYSDCLFHLSRQKFWEKENPKKDLLPVIKNYLDAMSNSETICSLEHLITLSYISNAMTCIRTMANHADKIIPFHKDAARRSERQKPSLSSKDLAITHAIQQEAEDLILHPKWEFMITGNLKLGDEVPLSVIAADCIGLNIFFDLMRLLYERKGDLFLWNKLVQYQDPWMQKKYVDFFEGLMTDQCFRRDPHAKCIAKMLLEKLEGPFHQQMETIVKAYNLS